LANAVVRNFSLFANGRKCGEATGIMYDQESGNEIQIGDGQVLGVSQGVKTVNVQLDSIIPYRGAQVARILEDSYDANQSIQVGLGIVGGRIHKLDLFCTKCQLKAEMKNGTCTGNWTLIGGAGSKVG
jgi:hypothetical protein